MARNLPAMQETKVQSLDRENTLEKGMATHSSILAWRIPWTEEPGRLQSMVSQRAGLDWTTFTFMLTLWRGFRNVYIYIGNQKRCFPKVKKMSEIKTLDKGLGRGEGKEKAKCTLLSKGDGTLEHSLVEDCLSRSYIYISEWVQRVLISPKRREKPFY